MPQNALSKPAVALERSGTRPAPRNRTLRLEADETAALAARLLKPGGAEPLDPNGVIGRVIVGDCAQILPRLPRGVADLLILDPPYNRTKRFGETLHGKRSLDGYADWLGHVIDAALPALKPTASVYICGDWQSSPALYAAAESRLRIRNRITWERE